MIGRLEVGKLGRGSQILLVLNVFMHQMEPHVKWHFFGQKVIFSNSDVPERFKESLSRFPANFKEISESQTFDLSRDQSSHRAKISHFHTMLGFTQYGSRMFGIDASSDPSKFCDDWPSKSRLNVKFQNQKSAKNGEFDVNEKGEFALRHFRHLSPFRGVTHKRS